jgi:catalase
MTSDATAAGAPVTSRASSDCPYRGRAIHTSGPDLVKAGSHATGSPDVIIGPGERAQHTQGTFLTGTFTAAEANAAGDRCQVAYLRPGTRSSVLARFTNSVPGKRDDRGTTARGLTVRIMDPGQDRHHHDLLSINFDRFVATDEPGFLELTSALALPTWRRMPRLASMVARRRTRLGPLVQGASLWLPSSYTRCEYYAVNTFVWLDGEGGTAVRFRWVPGAGKDRLLPPIVDRIVRSNGGRRGSRRSADYLVQDLVRRMGDGEQAQFHLEVQLGETLRTVDGGDGSGAGPVDATRRWAVPWQRIGTMTLDQLVEDPEELRRLDADVYSPVRLPPGICPHPRDELIAIRRAAYEASVGARTSSRARA